ncbi:MAG: hypothetical protein MI892_01785 [Desulfobacterales bacterium]|nr:hypothetical protein [Desulfobacterales bacterium]
MLLDQSSFLNIGIILVSFILTIVVTSYITYRILVCGIKIGRAVRDDRGRADGLNAAIETDSDEQ